MEKILCLENNQEFNEKEIYTQQEYYELTPTGTKHIVKNIRPTRVKKEIDSNGNTIIKLMEVVEGVHRDSATKTEKQWLKEGRLIKPEALGKRLWTNGWHYNTEVYYSSEETYKA